MSKFTFQQTPIAGVIHVTRKPMGDARGWLERVYCAQELAAAGWDSPPVQINRSFTQDKGTVRGLHYQKPPHAEAKMVSCLRGEIFDVAVDLRAGSPTLFRSYAARLSGDNRESLIIPEGVAHGFQTLTDAVEMLYLHSEFYTPEHEDSVHPQDPVTGIDLPLDISIISERDQQKDFLDKTFKGLRI